MRRKSTTANVFPAMTFFWAVATLHLSPAAAAEGTQTDLTIRVAGSGESLPDQHDWDLKSFVKRQQPGLRPTPDSRFQCPIRGKEVRWEQQNVYNPAAIVRGDCHCDRWMRFRSSDRCR